MKSLLDSLNGTVIQEGKVEFNTIDLNQLARHISAVMKFEAKRRYTKIILELQPEPANIYAAGSRIEQVLINMLSNSLEAMVKKQ